jgi:peptide-methionine (R)-S-oxide reductase
MKWTPLVALCIAASACTNVGADSVKGSAHPHPATAVTKPVALNYTPLPGTVVKTDEEWRKQLTPEQYNVLRKKGTERAFTGKYCDNHERGVYRCAACGQILFFSDAKFDSGTGWPSFFTPAFKQSVATHEDHDLFESRTEVVCGRCGSHLGHVFDDGPAPTGLRYCMNSAALTFEKAP